MCHICSARKAGHPAVLAGGAGGRAGFASLPRCPGPWPFSRLAEALRPGSLAGRGFGGACLHPRASAHAQLDTGRTLGAEAVGGERRASGGPCDDQVLLAPGSSGDGGPVANELCYYT